ncbi:MAG: GNAT family N-acetyltransferase [Defluviitaleaceae bacterium]|nr:GNAT family N-acetyltransferase [Defluviitaleaceae bacterium]
MIKKFQPKDLQACCDLYIKTFNAPPWNDTWTQDAAFRCLSDLSERKRFLGYTLWEGGELVGAVFAYTKTFYKGDEIYIDELFISPDHQRKGYGLALMGEIEKYARENSLTCITLLTAVHHPAYDFYEKQGYEASKNMTFMYKVVSANA